MTIDREQIQRDVEHNLRPGYRALSPAVRVLANHCRSLLAELDLRERSQIPVIPRGAQEKIARLEAELRNYKTLYGGAIIAAEVAEARLAKVPALVEAAKTLIRLDLAPDVENLALMPSDPTPLELMREYDEALAKIRDALAEWERE